MSKVSDYYSNFYQLNIQGTAPGIKIDEVETFLLKHYPNLRAHSDSVTDAKKIKKIHQDIQSLLFSLKDSQVICEIALRCYISEQIKQTCIALARQFGENYQFRDSDLYGFVLTDVLKKDQGKQFVSINQSETTRYISVARKILDSFDSNKQILLSTWTSRLTRSHPELTKFLKEQGLYFISDWAILNNTKPKQLNRILLDFHNFNQSEVDRCQDLLNAYHKVYLEDRKKQILNEGSQGRGKKCQPPSSDQLQRIAQLFQSSLTEKEVLIELENLAQLLKQYSYKNTRKNQIPFDDPDARFQLEQQEVRNSESSLESDDNEFLSLYRQQFLKSLKQAISVVVSRRHNKLKESKKSDFLTALKAYHCQGLSMSEIASLVDLQQFGVSRLLKLKDLRSDIQQEMLKTLVEQIKALAVIYTNPDELIKREKQIAIVLEEQTNRLIEEASSEERQKRKEPFKNRLAQYICNYLDQQEDN